MVGYNTSLSCVLNTTNGQGLDNQVVYWYLDGTPLGQSSTYFGFATYNLSVSEVSGLLLGQHQNSYKIPGDADYAGSQAEGVLLVMQHRRQHQPNAKTNRNTNPNAKTNRTPTPTPRQPQHQLQRQDQYHHLLRRLGLHRVHHQHPQQARPRLQARRGERDRLPKIRGRVVAARSAAGVAVLLTLLR